MKSTIYHKAWRAALVLALASCADQWSDLTPSDGQDLAADIAFSATVVGSRGTTRANASLVNKNEFVLGATSSTGARVGVFGYYTAGQTWDQVVGTTDYGPVAYDAEGHLTTEAQAAQTAFAAAASGQLWGQYNTNIVGENVLLDEKGPTPAFFYNLPLTIDDAEGNTNLLHYSEPRFWPNGQGGTEHVSFWAYYPYNATGVTVSPGVKFTTTGAYIGPQTGRGHLLFRMAEDATQNADLLVSDLVKDCSKQAYPLQTTDGGATYRPRRVEFTFRHLLAQVRIYANIFGCDLVAYRPETDTDGNIVRDAENKIVLAKAAGGEQVLNDYGELVTLSPGDPIPDDYGWETMTPEERADVQTVRWTRSASLTNIKGNLRPDFTMEVAFRNIRTQGRFTLTPHFDQSLGGLVYPCEVLGGLDSVFVADYVQNPYWFRYESWDTGFQHPKLNEDYMYGHFEETDAFAASTDALAPVPHSYILSDNNLDERAAGLHAGHHFNFAERNIFLIVPQRLADGDVPNVHITFRGTDRRRTGPDGQPKAVSAQVTVNMLNMNIKWEGGFIYSYAIVDELRPGDDRVLGPESVTVGFDPAELTDQW